jgi:hypothetical protein
MRVRRIILLFLIIATVFFGSAYAHDWYDAACCSGADCHKIACEAITEKGQSLFYDGYEFVNSMIRPSQDGACHVCISNEFSHEYSPIPHCIYIQQGS